MAFNWNEFPYTNFHELNLDFFINKFNEIFEEWASLYETLTTWKTDTDLSLAEWKADAISDIERWEGEVIETLNEWKVETGADIEEWERGVISDLGDWKNAFEEEYEALAERVTAIVSDTEDMVENLAEPFSSSADYSINDYVIYEGTLYRFVVAHTAGAWDATHVVQATAMEDIAGIKREITIPYDTDDWGFISDVAYPTGFQRGYFATSDGVYHASENYLCTSRLFEITADIVDITPPTGYYCNAAFYATTDISDFTDSISGEENVPLHFEGRRGQYAAITIGRFNGNASTYNTSAFIETCILRESPFVANLADDLENTREHSLIAGNNLLPLHDYETVANGVHIMIRDGVLTLKGRATATFRVKLSGSLYEVSSLAQDAWKAETISDFKVGSTYSLHNIILNGTLPSDTGVSLRNSSGTSIISTSIPEAKIASAAAFAMLYIPLNRTVDVTYIPAFIHGGVNDAAYTEQLNPDIHVPGAYYYEMPDMDQEYIYDSVKYYAIKFPETYRIDGPATRLMILCHGLSSDISVSTWGNASLYTLIEKFVNEGYAVLDVGQVTTQDWCNPNLIKRYAAAVCDAMQRYNIRVDAIYGESMGSLIALCLACMYHPSAVVIAGIRLDLAARYALLTAEQQAIVDTNLGFTDGYDAYKAAGWDKTAYSATDGLSSMNPVQFPPTFFVVGSTDTVTKTESLAKIDEIRRGGTITKTTEYTGGHSDVCYLTAGTSYDDTMAWFNTWRQ